MSLAFSQSSKTEVDFEKVGVKSWASSSEFEREDVKEVGISYLRKNFLNKNVTPIYIPKEFREYKYKNFYHDKKLKRAFKNKKRNGFRENNNRGSLSTVVYYDPNTNYEFLFNQIFKVIDIYRRGEGKLAENWIFIDILSILYQQGIDVLGQNQSMVGE